LLSPSPPQANALELKVSTDSAPKLMNVDRR
jgi:hypothetical protein